MWVIGVGRVMGSGRGCLGRLRDKVVDERCIGFEEVMGFMCLSILHD